MKSKDVFITGRCWQKWRLQGKVRNMASTHDDTALIETLPP